MMARLLFISLDSRIGGRVHTQISRGHAKYNKFGCSEPKKCAVRILLFRLAAGCWLGGRRGR